MSAAIFLRTLASVSASTGLTSLRTPVSPAYIASRYVHKKSVLHARGRPHSGSQLRGEGAEALVASPTGPLRWRYDFDYNDRGRGPKITSDLTVDADGVPVSLAVKGYDHYKSAVDEYFVRESGLERPFTQ